MNMWLSFSQPILAQHLPRNVFFSGFSVFLTILFFFCFFWRFVLVASGAEILWWASLKFKLLLATSRFHCHRSSRSWGRRRPWRLTHPKWARSPTIYYISLIIISAIYTITTTTIYYISLIIISPINTITSTIWHVTYHHNWSVTDRYS